LVRDNDDEDVDDTEEEEEEDDDDDADVVGRLFLDRGSSDTCVAFCWRFRDATRWPMEPVSYSNTARMFTRNGPAPTRANDGAATTTPEEVVESPPAPGPHALHNCSLAK
jgi:hypothetical protein